MAVSRAYQYLGALRTLEGLRHVAVGAYTIAGDDAYDRDAHPTLTFAMLASVDYVLDMYGDCISNVANPVGVVSISTNIVTLGLLEGAAAGTIFPEKTDDEVYGQAHTFYVIVVGQ